MMTNFVEVYRTAKDKDGKETKQTKLINATSVISVEPKEKNYVLVAKELVLVKGKVSQAIGLYNVTKTTYDKLKKIA